jgi:hypothetical protein
MYDSTDDTLEHIYHVGEMLDNIISLIEDRIDTHDYSKLVEPEKSIFDEYTPKLAASTYGSDEYKEMLSSMRPALEHHYEKNLHHPEHYEKGIDGMTLIDLIEMLVDWKAATLRHNNGDIYKSIEINKKRFGISDQLVSILLNTIKKLWE